ncbi:MAG: PulJ/GspJ family protein, partial [Phycisphaerae bacterium]
MQYPRSSHRAFTLVEVLVSLSILIIMMASVGEIFRVAGKSVRLGQATLETMSNVRTLEAQFQHDLSGLDRNGFLIIRGNYYAPPYNSNGWHYYPGNVCNYYYGFYQCISGYTSKAGGPTPSSDTLHWQNISGSMNANNEATGGLLPLIWQDDQLCFTAQGTFQHRTGNYNHAAGSSPGPFMDYLTSNSAVIWYGQLYVNDSQAQLQTYAAFQSGANDWVSQFYPQSSLFDPGPGLYNASSSFGYAPTGTPPTGIAPGDFVLGRHVTLLIAGSGTPLTGADGNTYAAYYNTSVPGLAVAYNAAAVAGNSGESAAYPASSRVTVAATTVSQINAEIASAKTTGMTGFSSGQTNTAVGQIADAFCYRYNTLAMPNASEVGTAGTASQLTNGYFRMTPIMMPGVPSFTVQWTDGQVYGSSAPAALQGQLIWYGLGNTLGYGGAYDQNYKYAASVEAAASTATPTTSSSAPDAYDPYVAVFDTTNRSLWPKA